jgi:hypothetical protein
MEKTNTIKSLISVDDSRIFIESKEKTGTIKSFISVQLSDGAARTVIKKYSQFSSPLPSGK